MKSAQQAKPLLPWLLAGSILGLVQVLAVALHDPLGVSTQFVVVESIAVNAIAPEAAAGHPILGDPKNQSIGYGFWFNVGLVAGAFVLAVALRRWRLRSTTAWWRANYGASPARRFALGFGAGFLILLGSRIAGGCTSGAFASGWAQLSLAALPMTIALFGGGMLAARIVYPKAPEAGPDEI